MAETAQQLERSRRIRRRSSVVHRRHALHIAVVLSKAALSGPSVCLRARAPCPLCVSYLRPDHARACSVAAGYAAGCTALGPLVKTATLHAAPLLVPWLRQVTSPVVQLTHGPGLRSLIVPRQRRSAEHGPCGSLRLRAKHGCVLRALLCRLYRHICVCARSTVVFLGVYNLSPLLTTLFCH